MVAILVNGGIEFEMDLVKSADEIDSQILPINLLYQSLFKSLW
jgi:hypothetical protein